VVASIVAAVVQFTGFSLKDFLFPSERLRQPIDEGQGAIVLSADRDGKIDWHGDAIQQVGPRAIADRTLGRYEGPKAAIVERLVSDIQRDLYADDRRLPLLLTRCVDLCDLVHLSGKY
jgi:hypothetical protein